MEELRVTRFPETFKKVAKDLASTYGSTYHGCSQSILATFMEILGIEDEKVLMAASCLAGGATRCLTCGAISGGLMVLGLRYGRRRLEDGPEAIEPAMEPAGEFVDRFVEAYGTTDCCELTGYDFKDQAQFQAFMDSEEAVNKCTERVTKAAGWVAEVISKWDGIKTEQAQN